MWSSISVVIPVYNSVRTLEELYQRLTLALSEICYDYQIILVDDGSRDNSYQKMLDLHHRDGKVKTIKLRGNYGQQNAIMCGLSYAEGDYVVTIDDDLQYLPEEIEKLLLEIDKGYDVVYGIPSLKKHSFYRRWGSKLTYYLFNLITLKPPEVKIGSFRVLKKQLLQKIIGSQGSFVYISALIFKYTSGAGNIAVSHEQRKQGQSNYNVFKLIRLFINLFIYYADLPLLKLFRSNKPTYVIEDIRL